MPVAEILLIALVGAGTGLLGGLFGKGGSAVATPLLAAIGVPAAVALAAPLPATVPATLAAASAYRRTANIDWPLVRTTVRWGVPATVAGALASRWVGGAPLVRLTEFLVIAIGVRLAAGSCRSRSRGAEPVPELVGAALVGSPVAPLPAPSAASPPVDAAARPPAPGAMVAVAVATGLVSGLLANSGGFLLAPLYLAALRLPVRKALGSSLAAAAVLAVPGTIVHAALGHIDWAVVAILALTSVPASFAGARLALATRPDRLERAYGLALVVLGAGTSLLG